MNKKSICLISTLLILSGCAGGGGNTDQTNVTPPPQENPIPPANNTPATSNNGQSANNNDNITSLIPPTNPQQRLQQINQGKSDPFGSIRPPAVVRIPANQQLPNIEPFPAVVREEIPDNQGQNSGATLVTSTQRGNQATNVVNSGNNPPSNLPNTPSRGNQNSWINNGKTSGGGKTASQMPSLNLCEIPEGEIANKVIPKPNVTISGIMGGNNGYVAIAQFGGETAFRRIARGDSFRDAQGNIVRVRDVVAYNSQPLITLASNSRTFSGGGLTGEVVFQLADGSQLSVRVGESTVQDTTQPTNQPVAFQSNLTKEQFNFLKPEHEGLKLISIENIVPRIVEIRGQDGKVSGRQEIIEISGYVCNNTLETVEVTDLILGLSSGNVQLPPLKGNFEGIQQGDVSNQANVSSQARLIKPGNVTLFRGSVANVPQFQTQEQIDVSLENWR